VLWTVAIAATLALAGCGSASGPGNPSDAASGKLVVWDWKSGDKTAAAYVEKAKADFAKKHPGVTVEFVAQPFDQYYTLLGTAIQAGKGPDVMMFNGGGQIRDRVDALVQLDQFLAEDKQRLTGWDAFTKDGKIYAAPVTLQGHPIYFNKSLYSKAGLDPKRPATTWSAFVADCGTITKATGATCFALGNKEGAGIQFWLSGLGSGVLTPQEYDGWLAGKRDWKSPNVKRVFELWKEANDIGLNNKGGNSTTMFTDAFGIFDAGKAVNIISLMSDIGHWKEFNEFLGADNVGVMAAPVVTAGAMPSLPFDGGIGYAVAKWTKQPAVAADLVRSLTSTAALNSFYADAGAIVSDTTISTSNAGPAVATLIAQLKTGKPALHVALSSKTIELMGRLSQQILEGSVSVDEALNQLAASDQA
jgi:multiple sugar transport system substrate-binding protein